MLHRIDNPFEQCDLKFASNDSTGEFEGYATKFNLTDQGGDTILPGAYADSIKKSLPKMFINHRHMDIPVGDWLAAKEDDAGLRVEGRIDLNHRDGKSLLSAMKRGAMNGLSTGVVRSTMKFERKDDGGRIIRSGDLREVSVVTFPMEENATILAVKSEIEQIEGLKDAELFLRDSGFFSRSAATAFVSRLRILCQSDSGDELREQITELKSRLARENATKRLHNIFDKYDLSKLIEQENSK